MKFDSNKSFAKKEDIKDHSSIFERNFIFQKTKIRKI